MHINVPFSVTYATKASVYAYATPYSYMYQHEIGRLQKQTNNEQKIVFNLFHIIKIFIFICLFFI